MRSAPAVVLLVVLSAVAASGCSGSGSPDEEPTLDRIDGPAQVDPSYDPFAVATTTSA